MFHGVLGPFASNNVVVLFTGHFTEFLLSQLQCPIQKPLVCDTGPGGNSVAVNFKFIVP